MEEIKDRLWAAIKHLPEVNGVGITKDGLTVYFIKPLKHFMTSFEGVKIKTEVIGEITFQTQAIDLPLSSNLFDIPINLEENIGEIGWKPNEADFEFKPEHYIEAVVDYEEANEKVCFSNVQLNWDSCDCGDGYGCPHPDYIYELAITDANGVHTVEVGEDYLEFEAHNTGERCTIPTSGSIGDFYRACQMCGIILEFTPYAKSLMTDIKDNKISLLEEDLECVHKYLDDLEAPRVDKDGMVYSIVGRIKALFTENLKQISDIETQFFNDKPFYDQK